MNRTLKNINLIKKFAKDKLNLHNNKNLNMRSYQFCKKEDMIML